MRITYRLVDEPRPGGLSHLVVSALWPLLALMLAGAWAGWAWLVFNSVAMGSATMRKEVFYAVAGILGSCLIALGLGWLLANNLVGREGMRYLVVVPTVWKLYCGMRIYYTQSDSQQLFEYVGGHTRNGLFVLIALVFVGFQLRSKLTDLFFAVVLF